jgi:hypothetical protein
MTTWSQTVTGSIVTFDPMDTLLPMRVAFHLEALVRSGDPSLNRSFVNMTPCPINVSSPIVTKSHTKE